MSIDSVHPLRRYREAKGLTLAGLSALLGDIAPSTLSYYELGQRVPKPEHMRRIRTKTGITPNDFYDFLQERPA